MGKIKLITDSLSDIPKEIADKYNITILPLRVRIGTKEYKDRIDLSPSEFHKKLEELEEIPQTSQVTPIEFKKAIEEAFCEGYKDVIIINGSGEVSGTHQSALIAKEEAPQNDIYVFDSKALSYGCGMIVTKAAKMALEDKSLDEIIEKIKEMFSGAEQVFSVETLKYLNKSGRLSSSKMVLGSLLNIKPILSIVNGAIEPIDKVRGNKKLYKRLIEVCIEKGLKRKSCIGLGHVSNKEGLKELREMIINELDPSEIIEIDVGCTIAAHTGPGVLGVFFISE